MQSITIYIKSQINLKTEASFRSDELFLVAALGDFQAMQRQNGRKCYLFLFLSESFVRCLIWVVLTDPALDTPSSLHRLLQNMSIGTLDDEMRSSFGGGLLESSFHSLGGAAVQLLFFAWRLRSCFPVLSVISFQIVPLAAVALLCRVTGRGLGRPGGLPHSLLCFLWWLLPPTLKKKTQPKMAHCVKANWVFRCVSQ